MSTKKTKTKRTSLPADLQSAVATTIADLQSAVATTIESCDETSARAQSRLAKVAMNVQKKLAKSTQTLQPVHKAPGLPGLNAVVKNTADALHNIKFLLNARVQLEVQGDTALLFKIVDRYAGQERLPLHARRYGIKSVVPNPIPAKLKQPIAPLEDLF